MKKIQKKLRIPLVIGSIFTFFLPLIFSLGLYKSESPDVHTQKVYRLVRNASEISSNSTGFRTYKAQKLEELKDYIDITGKKQEIVSILEKAWKLKDKKVVEINSTESGGGVAALLSARKKFYNKIGVNWNREVLEGSEKFSDSVKQIFNALQGEKNNLTKENFKILNEVCEQFAKEFNPGKYDVIVIHDNILPLAGYLQQELKDSGVPEKEWPKFIWRNHMDTSNPNLKVWNKLKSYVNEYDEMVATKEKYINSLPEINIPTSTFYPTIDPLDKFNHEVTQQQVNDTLQKIGLDKNDKIYTQISRFDKWKGYQDTIKAFKELKDAGKLDKNSKLVLIGESASDDTEGGEQLNQILDLVDNHYDIKVLLNGEMPKGVRNPEQVMKIDVLDQNVIQWYADVVVHPPYAAGFEMSLTSSLLKSYRDKDGDGVKEGRLVIATEIGGIPDQIGNNPLIGILISPGEIGTPNEKKIEELKNAMLIKGKEFTDAIGKNARQKVINDLLTTNLVNNWLGLFNSQLGTDGKKDSSSTP